MDSRIVAGVKGLDRNVCRGPNERAASDGCQPR